MNDTLEFYTNSEVYGATGILSWLGVLLGFCGSSLLFYANRQLPFMLICLGTIPFVLEPGMTSIFPLAWSLYDNDGNIISQASYPNFPWIYALIKATGVFLLGIGLFSLGIKNTTNNKSLNPTQKDKTN